ncbi:4'-phosphopantetheinyl transferase family protein [Paenibacillus crassostreae]|uniref:Uncharacterized protein n=1 Tax=Paenibacillus crassostreae TaxID=1763538 RepID=A0A167FGN3_9BACL|nr:4'-phosphopantetheinyl transferase superfamily protein [Paenibacillus crassostreae]AOZ94423.1 hypothetical protein LPB68_20925 [Paenibacillus crassostreae]OAB76540.1 hypothetical protein PNBC_03815 [Paenibacillus crassostreae]
MQSIAIVHIPADIRPDYLTLFLDSVSEERRQKFTRFIHKEDAYRSLVGELLIRTILSRQLDVSHKELRFDYNSYGKPMLSNYPQICFNISHSGKWVTIAWGNHGQCLGIDIEEIKQMDLQFAANLFTPQENWKLASYSGGRQLDYFYQLWTLKESYMKAIGKGLSIPLDSFSIVCNNIGEWFSPEAKGFHFKSFRIDSSHILSVCSNSEAFPDHIQEITLSELYDSLL